MVEKLELVRARALVVAVLTRHDGQGFRCVLSKVLFSPMLLYHVVSTCCPPLLLYNKTRWWTEAGSLHPCDHATSEESRGPNIALTDT